MAIITLKHPSGQTMQIDENASGYYMQNFGWTKAPSPAPTPAPAPAPVAPPAPTTTGGVPQNVAAAWKARPSATPVSVQSSAPAITNIGSNINTLTNAENNLIKVKTGSIGADGKPIYDVFAGSEHIANPNDPRLAGKNIENLPEGKSPSGFQSNFKPLNFITGNTATDQKLDEINKSLVTTENPNGTLSESGQYYKIGNDVFESSTDRHIELDEFQDKGLNFALLPEGKPIGAKEVMNANDKVNAAIEAARNAKEDENYLALKTAIEELKQAQIDRQTAIDELYAQQAPLREAYIKSLSPGTTELGLQQQLVTLRQGIEQSKLATQTEMDRISGAPAAQGLKLGAQASLQKQADRAMQTQLASEKNLIDRLGIESSNRQAMAKGLEAGLSFLGQDIEMQQKAQDRLDKQETNLLDRLQKLDDEKKKDMVEILNTLSGIDPSTLSPETIAQLAQIAAQKGIALQDILQALQIEYDKATLEKAKITESMKEKEPEKWSEPYKLGGDWIQKNETTGEIKTAVNMPASSPKTGDDLKASPSDIKKYLLTNKRLNPDIPYYDLWGQLSDDLKKQGLNPNNYDQEFWEILHPEGLEGYKKHKTPAKTGITNPFDV